MNANRDWNSDLNPDWTHDAMPLSAGLRLAARLRPDVTALVVVDAQGDAHYSYAEVDRRATRIAGELVALGGAAGDRALLLMDSGIDYVSAFYGCLYAGVIAVPVYPPESTREQHVARLKGIAADADVRFTLTTTVLNERFETQYLQLAPEARIVPVDALVCAPDAEADCADCIGRAPLDVAPGDVAFLQYTSGSTGSPKGVMVSHGNLVANQRVLAAAWGVDSADVYVSWLPLYHDMGLIGAMMQTFFSGARLVLMSPQFFLEHPVRWLQAIERHRGTLTGAPDFAYRLCADYVRPATAAALDLSSLRVAYSGAEPVRSSTLEAFAARFAPAGFERSAFFPCYGLAEATLMVSGGRRGGGFVSTTFRSAPLAEGRVEAAAPGEPGLALVGCGSTFDHHVARIVDPHDGSVNAHGRVGEIEVCGPSVCAGYWRKPAASADVLKAGGAPDGNAWLRTGDLGFVHDGQLFIASRRKDLIIVRGRNLYPQDIEQAIEDDCDFVRKGRVAAFDAEVDNREGPGVAAEIPPLLKKRLSAQQIVERLSRCVFDACGEAPAAIVLLNPGALPKTSSGKLQRSATREGWRERTLDAYAIWERGRFVHADQVALPEQGLASEVFSGDGIEYSLAACWSEVLGGAPAQRDAHFFASGGSSLSAAQLASAIDKRWDCAVEIGFVFEFPVFSEMALAIARLARSRGERDERREEDPPLVRTNALTVSHAQRRQLFAAKLDPQSTAYHIAMGIRLRGRLDHEALTQSLAGLVAAHEVLRTTFAEENGVCLPRVQPAETCGPLLEEIGEDAGENVLSDTDADAIDAAIDTIARRFAAAPFDLECGPLIRFGLLTIGESDTVLVLALHHIAADGWSMRVLLDEWAARYRALVARGAFPAHDADAPRYADYAAWQERWLHGAQAATQLAYWSRKLANAQPAAALPFERSVVDAAANPTANPEAARIDFDIPAAGFERIRRAASRSGTTPFMLMLAAWNAWLHRATGRTDICTGVPVANRRSEAVHRIVGFFVNTLVVRSEWTPATSVAALVADLRHSVLDGLAHQELPFDVLVERLKPERGVGEMPWFRTLFNYLLEDHASLRQLPGLDASHWEIAPGHAKVALALDLRESGGDALRGFLTFARHAFAPPTAQRIVAQYLRVLDAIVAALLDEARGHAQTLADLTLLARDEVAGLRRLSHGEAAPAGEPVHIRFAHHAEAEPERIALVDRELRLTYAQLSEQASRIAGWLVAQGLAHGQRVAVIADRSAVFVAATLGVLKAGGAYVPLDASTPPARIEQTLADCGAAFVLAEHTESLERTKVEPAMRTAIIAVLAQEGPRVAGPRSIADPGQPAYVIYTSGSTGKPKGVVVSQASLANYVSSVLSLLQLPPAASFAMVSTVAADLGHTTLFGALASGGTLHLIDRGMALDADRFAHYMAAHRIDVLKIVPGHLAALLHAAHPIDVLPHAALVLGGEASAWELVERIRALTPSCRVFNHYGPTETTVGVAMQDAACASREAATLPIGRPLANQRIWILDSRMEPVGIGAVGELYLGGRGVAQGYLDRPGLTAERFVPDPFEPGARLYRSGDRARRLEDGAIEYLGRGDDQIKIRGYRVEPGEIAARLRALDGVHEAFVIATPESRLAAFVTARAGRELGTRALRQQLAGSLPGYMVPAVLRVLDALPLNRNGKIDREALLALARGPVRPNADGEVPQGDTECRLAAIWADVLGEARGDAQSGTGIRRSDDFFAIGGHSLAAMRALSRIRAAWGIDLPLREMLGSPSLRDLAATINSVVAHAAQHMARDRVIPAASRPHAVALSPLQQRIWIVDQLEGGRLASYNMAIGLSFEGVLDAALLEASLVRLVERHEVLRAYFPSEDGLPSMAFRPDVKEPIALVDVDLPVRDAWRGEIEAMLAAESREAFDLAAGPLMRARLVRFDARHHVLILVLHHIVADGESIHILLRELTAIYCALRDGQAPVLSALPVQYADYAEWQRASMTPQRLRDEQAFWRAYLQDAPHCIALPTYAPRPAKAAQQGDAFRCALPAQTGAGVRALAARQRTTPFVVLMASFQWFLHVMSGQRDIVVGTDVADRHRPELEELIGFFVNVLPIRSTVPAAGAEPPGFAAWIAQSQRAVWEALEHRALPFDRIVEAVKAERRRDGNPLVQVLFVLRDLPRGDTGIPDVGVEMIRSPTVQSKFDMAIFVELHEGGYEIDWVFSTALFARATVADWFDRWASMLEAFVSGADALPWRSEWSDVPAVAERRTAA